MENLTIKPNDYFVFYVDNDIIIYKDKQQIHAKQCDGDLMASFACPHVYQHYEFLDAEHGVVLIFGGKTLVYIDKSGTKSFQSILSEQNGRFLSSPMKTDDPNCFTIATQFRNLLHLMKYDFINAKRISQSASWQVSQLNDINLCGKYIYLLLDNSLIVQCNNETCETLWKRFEPGRVEPRIVIDEQKKVLYACSNILKIVQGEDIQNIRIPLARPDSLEFVVRDKLFYTSNNRKHICCYNLTNNNLEWEITGSDAILRTIRLIDMADNNLAVIQTVKGITIINTSAGKIVNYFRLNNLQDMKLTKHNLLLQADKTNIVGVANVNY